MPLHILTSTASSFYSEDNFHFYLWNALIKELGYGLSEVDTNLLVHIRKELKMVIDKSLASRESIGSRLKQVNYGDSTISLDLSSLAEKQAFFLIQTYNNINQALSSKNNVAVLILPDHYGYDHEKLFTLLKTNHKSYLIEELVNEFGMASKAIIDDFIKLGVFLRSKNTVELDKRLYGIPFLLGVGFA
ncbi:hypothetical protein [Chryseosolibacter indicus]|uniref:Uncharacterized protein n=1 Tax=Chryseosolibacter indicus TaxID=2782351 RepID=A0ABS5VWK8_9BACT|nr:hypothetical protein [Chryseosolibacter indicus]MBT1705810.1 hypothetical protein [Chryseosolibacter indicus]